MSWKINNETSTNITFNGRSGFSDIIDISSLTANDYVKVTQTFQGEYNPILIGVRYVDDAVTINIFETAFVYMKKTISDEICYKVNELKPNKDGSIFINDLESTVKMNIKNSNGDMIRTELIEYNFTFPLSYNELQHTICFSSYNNNDIDLSFQIVYTDLLETNQLSNHMILNLATIYKRSVDYGAVSIHKQPILTDNYYNRYTHLKGIKGNPVLYAFDYGIKYEYITSSILDSKLSEGKIIKSSKG